MSKKQFGFALTRTYQVNLDLNLSGEPGFGDKLRIFTDFAICVRPVATSDMFSLTVVSHTGSQKQCLGCYLRNL